MPSQQVIQPPFFDPPIVDHATGQQHSQAWTEYHQSVADRLARLQAGSTGGSEAAPGDVGEVVTRTVNLAGAVGLINGAANNIVAMPLTPGDWEVWGSVVFNPAASTTMSGVAAWVRPFSAVAPVDMETDGFTQIRATLATGQRQVLTLGRVRVLETVSTTYYLSALAYFGVASMSAYGTVYARRMR